jgi:hypothetical protein
MIDTLEDIHYVSHMSEISNTANANRKKRSHTSMILIVSPSRLATFILIDAAMHNFLGMLPSCTLGFRYVMNLHMAGHSTKQIGYTMVQ